MSQAIMVRRFFSSFIYQMLTFVVHLPNFVKTTA
ncbi:Hypothetical protein, conserved [Brucella abortus str. 2308 A]|nr:conserved hypothetical protein [Brucella melitensis M5-90]EEP63525.1 Hypothetical protein, conserved [Brucella abortus str. 2308 A]